MMWNCELMSYKKVSLCNIEKYRYLSERKITAALLGMGAYEWEEFFAKKLIYAIESAKELGKTEANLTNMFSYKMTKTGYLGRYYLAQPDVANFLKERLFDVVSETDDELKVTLKEGLFAS